MFFFKNSVTCFNIERLVSPEQDPNGTFWHSPLHYLILLLFMPCCGWLIHYPFPQDNIFRLDANYFENGRGKSPYDPKMQSSSLLIGEPVRDVVVLALNCSHSVICGLTGDFMLLSVCQMENCTLERQQTSWDETLPFSEHSGHNIQSELSSMIPDGWMVNILTGQNFWKTFQQNH